MKLTVIQDSKKRVKRNRLVAHSSGEFSYRIDGRWTRRVKEMSSKDYLRMLRPDRERLILREFYTGRSVTGSPVIVSRPTREKVAA